MTLPHETVLTGAPHPGTELQLLESPGGYYLGFLNRDGGHYSRETIYMTYADAAAMLEMVRLTSLSSLSGVAPLDDDAPPVPV